ncbi:phosphopantetheine-binding protein [Hyalangium minutum]|uniref:Acyl carrier protein n=1 Tax=Hyalangium minutum TaxID=394096 RepID=A0A085WSJ4_9BACT|nr:acyl carrier protein [Hyalangium minutum]KFE70657.1 Acyl carrier protein [Hyalangium minutum]
MTAAVPASAAEVQKIEQQVREVVAEALARDLSEVKLETLLMGDLGAESLDFLDIVFKLERAFDIQITRGEMERAARGTMSDEEFAPGGVISETGLARLRELMPEAASHIQPGLRPAQILSLFSVKTFVNLVLAKRQGQSV